MLTKEQIESAKKRTKYSTPTDVLHEHPDCIRMAYEWLDAQKKIKGLCSQTYPVKHLIEQWCGRYVSISDVEVAAELHPEVRGNYPYFNISSRLTEPTESRLEDITEAFSQKYHQRSIKFKYPKQENSAGIGFT